MCSAAVSAAVVGASRPHLEMAKMPRTLGHAQVNAVVVQLVPICKGKMPSRQPAKPTLSEAEGMPALQRTGDLLVLLGGRTHRQFAKQAQHRSSGTFIGQVFERDGRSEVGRGGIEANVQKIFVPPRGQRIDRRITSR